MDNEHRPGPVALAAVPGKPLVPEPFAADYHDEVPEEMYALIDEMCPQDVLSQGRLIAKFA